MIKNEIIIGFHYYVNKYNNRLNYTGLDYIMVIIPYLMLLLGYIIT